MKKRDWLVIAAVVLLALVSLLALRLAPGAAREEDTVLVYLGDALYGTYPLAGAQTVLIEQEDGAWNRLRITGEGVYMEDANCKNHDCIAMGTLTAQSVAVNRATIVCLPHGLVVELVLAGE